MPARVKVKLQVKPQPKALAQVGGTTPAQAEMSGLLKSIFQFNGHELTAITDENGQPWFVGKEVCEILGLQNVSRALIELDQEDKKEIPGSKVGCDISKLRIITESGLYALIFKSRKPEAKAFKQWVTETVLPSCTA